MINKKVLYMYNIFTNLNDLLKILMLILVYVSILLGEHVMVKGWHPSFWYAVRSVGTQYAHIMLYRTQTSISTLRKVQFSSRTTANVTYKAK